MDEEEWYLCHNSRREGGSCLLSLFPIPKSINPQVRSRENFKQWFTGLSTAFPDLHFSFEDKLAEGDKVVYRYTLYASHSGSWWGVSFAMGRISRTALYAQSRTLKTALYREGYATPVLFPHYG